MTHVGLLIVLLGAAPVAGAEEEPPPASAPARPTWGGSPLSQPRYLLHEADDSVDNLRRALLGHDEAIAEALSPSGKASAYTDKALALLRLGDLQGSKGQRRAYYKRGKLEAEKGIAANASYADAHFMRASNLGSWMREKGVVQSLFLLDDLKAGFQRTLELDSGHLKARLSLARIDEQLPRLLGGSKKRAEQRYRTLLKQDPHFTLAMIFYAEFLAERGRKDESIQWLKRVISEEQPTEPADFRRFDRPRAEVLLEQFSK